MPRNGSGTYTLPSGNPVVAGTTIEATWANTTLNDLATEMTGSLSRSGSGGMTGPLRLDAGTAAVPALAWSTETTTGLYRAGTNDVRLAVATSDVMRWQAAGVSVTGTLGVSAAVTLSTTLAVTGAATLSSTLAVTGTTTLTGAATLTANPTLSAGTVNGVLYLNGSKVATAGSALTFDGTNLGVGTASPGAKLDVNLDSGGTAMSIATTTQTPSIGGGGQGIRWGWNGSTNGPTIRLLHGGSYNEAGLIFSTWSAAAEVERMRLDASGNVGIGTTSPGTKLSVNDPGTGLGFTNAASGNFNIGLLAGTGSADAYVYQRANAPLLFATNNTERMRLDASGNLGIGTASPATKLHVNTGAAGYGITVAASSQTSNTYQFGIDGSSNFAIYDTNAAAQRLIISPSGNLGIGVVPSAWGGGFKALEMTNGSLSISGNGPYVNQNAVFTTDWVYKTTAAAAQYYQVGGTHAWRTAASGTAGNVIAFADAMYLDNNRNLGLNTLTFGTSAVGVLSLGSGTAPTTGPADTVQLFSVDRSAGNTIPAVRCEGSGVTNAGITNTTVTTKIAMQVNGTIYYLLATTNAT